MHSYKIDTQARTGPDTSSSVAAGAGEDADDAGSRPTRPPQPLQFADVVADEERHLGLAQGETRWGLALSGGGVRSAAFCLGAIQGLSGKRWLSKFDFLSTVSGGGYVGTWLSTWARNHADGIRGVEAALSGQGQRPGAGAGAEPATAPNATEPPAVRHVRSHSSYLSPARGLSGDAAALAGIFARNLLVHWMVLVPILAALLLLPRILYPGSCRLLDAFGLSEAVPGETRCIPALATILPSAIILAFWLVLVACSLAVAAFVKSSRSQRSAIWLETLGRIGGWMLVGAVGLLLLNALVIWFPPWLLLQPALQGFIAPWPLTVVSLLVAVLSAAWTYGSRIDPSTRQELLTLGQRIGLKTSELVAGISLLLILFSLTLAVDGVIRRLEVGQHFAAVPEEKVNAGLLERISGDWAHSTLLTVQHRPLCLKAWENPPESWNDLWASPLRMQCLRQFPDDFCPHHPSLSQGKSTLSRAFCPTPAPANLASSSSTNSGPDARTVSTTVPNADPAPESSTGPEDQRTTTAATPPPGGEGKPVAEGGNESSNLTGPALGPFRMAEWGVRYLQGLERHRDTGAFGSVVTAVLLAFWLGISWFVGRVAGINRFSLAEMYRMRLRRAFIGAAYANSGEDPPLETRTPVRPLQLFNTALNNHSTGSKSWNPIRCRPFTLSALHCGGPDPDVGYIETRWYGKSLSASRAMAVSGAAVSPAMGQHASSLVSALLAFFNIRLGWWLRLPPKPEALWQAGGHNAVQPRSMEPGNAAWYALKELTSQVGGPKYGYLSDGGHFENLGIYALVQRRCQRIVAIDATWDPDYTYACLQQSLRLIRVELGVDIDFTTPLPRSGSGETGVPYHAVATIRYSRLDPNLRDGTLVYLKPLLSGREPLDLLGYYRASRAAGGTPFPHQSTSDQFFDFEQFESYRALGQLALETAFADWDQDLPRPKADGTLVVWPGALAPPSTAISQPASQEQLGALAPMASRSEPLAWTKSAKSWLEGAGALAGTAAIAAAVSVTAVVAVQGTVALSEGTVRIAQGETVRASIDITDMKSVLNIFEKIDVRLEQRLNSHNPPKSVLNATESLQKSTGNLVLTVGGVARWIDSATLIKGTANLLQGTASQVRDAATHLRDSMSDATTLTSQLNDANETLRLIQGDIESMSTRRGR